MSEEKIKEIIKLMEDMLEDATVPRNVKIRIENSIKALKEKNELSIRVHKALNEIDEIADDTNMEPYTRSQIWNIVSELESLS